MLVAIGGSKKIQGVSDFDIVFNNISTKNNFISSSISFMRKHGFDGINLDWQYPREDGKTNDTLNLVQVVKEMKVRSKTLLITLTLPSRETDAKGFDIPNLDPHVDFYCMLTYNYHSPHERSVNHHSPLQRSQEISACSIKANLNVNDTVHMYLEKRANKSKLILGIPLYGKCFALENANYNKTGSAALGPYKNEPCDKESVISYSKMCKELESKAWKPMRPEPCRVGPYVTSNNLWIGYDDEKSVEEKGVYVSENNLGGVFFWTLEKDDYTGECGKDKFPLIQAAERGLNSKSQPCRDKDTTTLRTNIIQSSSIDNNSTNQHVQDRDRSYNPFKFASRNIYTGIWGIINFLVGILGNLLTLTAIPYAAKRQRHNLHKNWYASTVYILNLAVFDLGFCIFGMPNDILLNLGIAWPFGNIGCKVFNFLGPIFAYGDWYALGLIAITRALYMVKAKDWEAFCYDKRKALALIVGLWAFNIILCVPRFYPSGKEYMNDEYSGTCQYVEESSSEVASYSLTVLHKLPHYMAFSITFATIIVTHFIIWRLVSEKRRKLKFLLHVDVAKAKKDYDKKDLRLTGTTLAIICILFSFVFYP